MRGTLAAGAAITALAITLSMAPASADPPPPECERIPILGLNPQVREICDLPMQPDGTWTRWRWYWNPRFVHSTCGDYGVMTRTGYVCPDWAPHDSTPANQTPVDKYVLTVDTVPPGEPGYLG